eukprot:CAMPEP_0184699644 /NCGR_PEP_ID=MMETSP0313-20130426/5846_1 /TAXON_ID=2792 /ORGANISM="Porphyridium aerugineum, Strain SAG 1380-2" /LENGTH=221 /DNA_ID=CAMNT_0027158763 /DNA_START=89 /DNA_END=754 /DNA_ORIENTATION=+
MEHPTVGFVSAVSAANSITPNKAVVAAVADSRMMARPNYRASVRVYQSSEPTAIASEEVSETPVNKLSEQDNELLQAALKGEVSKIYSLIDQGANPHVVDENGRTLLHIVSAQGITDIVKMLVNLKVDLSVPDNIGLTPLHMAAGYKRPNTVKMLLDAGADTTITDKRGQTPLELTRMLLDNAPDKKFFVMPNKDKELLREIIGILDPTSLPITGKAYGES